MLTNTEDQIVKTADLLLIFRKLMCRVINLTNAWMDCYSSTATDPAECLDLPLFIKACVMMMVLCPKAGSMVFMPPGDEMSEVASHCLPLRQLWVSNLSKVTTQWLEVDSNLRPFGLQGREHSSAPPRLKTHNDESN